MKTSELIDSLARDLGPVSPLPRPARLTAQLLGILLPPTIVMMPLLGMRHDIDARAMQPWPLAVSVLLLLTCGMAATVLVSMLRPGDHTVWLGVWIGLTAWVVVLGAISARTPWMGEETWGKWLAEGLYCTLRTILVSLTPIAGGLWLLRRGAVTRPGAAGAILGFAGVTLGALALHWTCDLDEPSHLMVWHYLIPVALMPTLCFRLSTRVLRW